MNIQESVAFVTGANRGIGKAFVEALVQAGVRRIYAAARSLDTLNEVVAIAPDLIIPIALDVTNIEQVNAAAQTAQDVTLLINNAGVIGSGGLFAPNSVETAQWEMNTNYFGTLSMVRAFAPILQRHSGGAIVNMLSVVSIASAPVFGSYSASKAALNSLTQDIRAELANQGTQVVGVFPGPVDTAMTEGMSIDKATPIAVAKTTLQAVEAGLEDVYPDPVSQSAFSAIAEPLKAVEKMFAGWMPQ
ncbi:short-chain dehydrogenase/reductase SDR [Pseudanabaena sp. lw0831]|uniref:SDR family oxidoreductase n=1 Tax=Pseudanabaena sp. lw0831 TaxID=1357935 RepID=UPI0019156615|nr:SDR family oxidoreductase [Pseudanabaena sp. lw0831]GBO55670.1 short-chain dehydrogenase/reductase SDR [Pseudanabaena sp. lw0831]